MRGNVYKEKIALVLIAFMIMPQAILLASPKKAEAQSFPAGIALDAGSCALQGIGTQLITGALSKLTQWGGEVLKGLDIGDTLSTISDTVSTVAENISNFISNPTFDNFVSLISNNPIDVASRTVAEKILNPTAILSIPLTVPVYDSSVVSRLEGIDTRLLDITQINTEISFLNRSQLAKLSSLEVKEYILDCVTWAVTKNVVEKVTEEVMTWVATANQTFTIAINESGQTINLNESYFVQNIPRYLENVSRAEARNFITELQEELVKSNPADNIYTPPYSNELLATIKNSSFDDTPFVEKVKTTVPPEFYEDFQAGGGWASFLEYTLNPFNDPVLAVPLTQFALQARQDRRVEEQTMLLEQGQGFLPETRPDSSAENSLDRIIVTPGQPIKNFVNQNLFSVIRQLENADEISEVVGVLLKIVVDNIFKDAGSLLEKYGSISIPDKIPPPQIPDINPLPPSAIP